VSPIDLKTYRLRLHRIHSNGFVWRLDEEGRREPLRIFDRKRIAVAWSLALIERHGGTLFIHRLNGSVQERWVYPGASAIDRNQRTPARNQPAERFRLTVPLRRLNKAAAAILRAAGGAT
jgi:hypothetical protein